MASVPVPTFVDFLFDLQKQECTPPEDWNCGICLEEIPQVDRSLEVDEVPVKLACGHIFDLLCIYTWLNAGQAREEQRDTCPLCRSRLYDGYDTDDKLAETVNDHMSAIYFIFFNRQWENRTASAWLTGSIQEILDSAIQDSAQNTAPPARDWALVISQLVHAHTAPDGAFVGRLAVCDGKTVSFMCLGHKSHGHLWLELFLAMRVFRERIEADWMRPNEMFEFEKWLVQKSEQYKVQRARLGQPREHVALQNGVAILGSERRNWWAR